MTFGERAQEYLTAVRSGDPGEIKAKINAAFGELYAPGGGDAPAWTEVAKLRMPYSYGELPIGVVLITMGVDVQKNRLVYVVRGWGARATSWLLEYGELWGSTAEFEVWDALADLIENQTYGGLNIALTLVDSGYRPEKPDKVPEHMVYDFCLRHQRLAKATKGASTNLQGKPFHLSKLERTPNGTTAKYSVELIRVNTDWCKSWVHERIRWPIDQLGAFNIASNTPDAYCQELVSEARVLEKNGRAKWVQLARNNHAFDAECLAYLAGYMLNVQRIPEGYNKPIGRRSQTAERPAPPPPRRDNPWLKSDSWLGNNGDWFGR